MRGYANAPLKKAHGWFFCISSSVRAGSPGSVPEAAAGQPAAPERRESRLHPPSRPGLPLQGDLCHGEAQKTTTHKPTNKTQLKPAGQFKAETSSPASHLEKLPPNPGGQSRREKR